MKIRSSLLIALLVGALFLSFSTPATCLGAQHSLTASSNKHNGKSVKSQDDTDDEYSHAATIADPLQPINRGIFWVNHQLYRYILKPISKTYDAVLPSVVRKGVYNVFDNIDYPDRVVNNLLQWKLKRAGKETEKFLLNSVVGVGGLIKVSDRFPALVDVPPADTGQTFAKWGIGHGAYVVLPLFGPKSLRDTVGLAGDYALSPTFWLSIWYPRAAWTLAFSVPDSTRSLHGRLSAYDAVTADSVDRYLSARSAYVQNRQQAATK